jgi:hypothetical protein
MSDPANGSALFWKERKDPDPHSLSQISTHYAEQAFGEGRTSLIKKAGGVLAGVGDLPLWGCTAGWRGVVVVLLVWMVFGLEISI